VLLAVELGQRVDQLARDEKRPLLAVQELGEAPRRHADLGLAPLLVREAFEELRTAERHRDVQHGPFLTDGPRPVDGRGTVPLVFLGRLVERCELLVRRLVIEVPERVELVRHFPGCRGLYGRHAGYLLPARDVSPQLVRAACGNRAAELARPVTL